MLSRHLTRPQTGVRRLQQPQGVVSSTCASKLRLGPVKLPGCQRWTARSRATSWNVTSSGFYSNNQDVNSYPAGTTAAAGAAGSSSSGLGSGPATAGAAAWPSGTPSSFTPSPASTWEEEGAGSGWKDYQGGDWGTSTLPGDWGEAGSNTAAAQPDTANQQQQQQQTGQQYGYAEAASSGFKGSFDQQQQQQASDGRWPFADSTFQQQQQQPGSAGCVRSPVLPSDITLLGRRDADSMLPLFPSPDQARFYQPRTVPERLVQVLGSFGLSVALSKSAVLAGPALLFPIWGPWVRAGVRNVQMYLRQFTCVGLWRSEVLAVRVNTVPYAYRDPTGTLGDTVTVTVGDPWQGGAATELTFPYQAGCEDIVEGEPAELLVLSQEDTFFNFKVVREVYLPQSGMWLSEYPFVDREVFLDVSLAIERGRQAATGTAAGGTMPPNPPAAAAAAAGVQQPYRPAPMYTPPGFAPPGFASGPGFAPGPGFASGPGFAAAAGFSGAPGFMPAAAAAGFRDQPSAGSGLPYAAGSPAAYAAASGGVAYSSMPFTTASPPSWSYPGAGVGAVPASTPPYQAGYGSPFPSGVGQGLMNSAAAAVGANGSNNSSSSAGSSKEGADPAAAGASSNGIHSTAADAAGDEQQGSSSSWGDNVTDSSSTAAWSNGAAGGSSHMQYNSSSTGQAGSEPSSNGSSSSSGTSSWQFDGQASGQDSMGAAGMSGYVGSSSSSGVGGYGSSSSSGLPSPAMFAMDLVEDVADAATGVVSNVAGAATGVAAGVADAATGVVSNVAGAATGVAAGVADAATGVAASVAAGFGGWFSAAPDGSSSSSSGSDTAVVPDVIIEGPGTYWSPGGYGAGSSGAYYGSSGYGGNSYMDSRPWAQQQQQQPGAGFGPMYSGNDPAAAAGYGGRWYEGYAGYSQGAASPGGFNGWSSSRGYADTAYPGSGGSSSAGGSPFPGQGAAGYPGYSSGPAAANPYSWSGPAGGDSTFNGSSPDAASGTQQQEQNPGTWRSDRATNSAATAAGFEGSNSSSPQQQPRA